MKDFSFLLLKNSFGAKMKKGIRTFCNNGDSTSILNQNRIDDDNNNPCLPLPSVASSPYVDNNTKSSRSPPTLEEMILQLELEEEIARRAKVETTCNNNTNTHRRMSSVNNSDILRSARNALNQYPRFSLDGRDAMYRSSFRNLDAKIQPGRNSVCCDHDIRRRYSKYSDKRLEKRMSLPPILAGESVVWCKPGIVAKLMGLDAIPVPVKSEKHSKESMNCAIKRQNLRRRAEREAMERRLAMNIMNYGDISGIRPGSSSRTGYCVMKPVAVEPVNNNARNWPT